MNDEQSEEWRAIRAEQEALRAQAERLERRMAQFEKAEAITMSLPPALPTTPATPPPTAEAPAPVSPVPPPPPVAAAPPTPVFVPPAAPVFPPVAPVAKPESWEMKVGSGWFVYLGVAMLLAALVFLGDAFYHNIIPHMGPASKVGLLYLGAGAFTGLGLWLERSRSAREFIEVRNYARVVLGGGLAAVYFATYAAHYFPNLRVIGSPAVSGVLLLGWTAFMVWMADRRGSETLASFAMLLAFDTSAVNEAGGFPLLASLPLTAGAVFLMRRHLWRIFPFAALLATFGGYAYWHSLVHYGVWNGWNVVLPPGQTLAAGGLWIEGGFLLLYWLAYTWVAFSTRAEILPDGLRATFAGLNNGAFFVLGTALCLEHLPGSSYWRWPLALGVVLLTLAETGRRLPRRLDQPTQDVYLLEGVMLVSLGFISYFSGWQLSIILALESVVLVAAAGRRGNRWLLGASLPLAVLAFLFAMAQISLPHGGNFRLVGLVVGATLAGGAWLCESVPITRLIGTLSEGSSLLYELLTLAICVAWGEEYFPYGANFALFALAGGVVLVVGIEFRRERFILWSGVLTSAGLVLFWLAYGNHEHRQPIQWLGIACMAAEQQFGRRRAETARAARFFPANAQAALVTAAVLTAWVSWSALLEHRPGIGLPTVASWPIYGALVFTLGLALHERSYRRLALLVLLAAIGHVALIDIWYLDSSLERFFSLLCLGVVLLAIGFVYTRYQSRLNDLF